MTTSDDGPPRLALDGHVDRAVVDAVRLALRGTGGCVLDLARVCSWDPGALPALTGVLETAPEAVVVVTPPATSFLGVLDAADLHAVWGVYDDVRRLRLAADRRAARPVVLTSGPATPRHRVFGPSRRLPGLPTLGLHRRRTDEEEP